MRASVGPPSQEAAERGVGVTGHTMPGGTVSASPTLCPVRVVRDTATARGSHAQFPADSPSVDSDTVNAYTPPPTRVKAAEPTASPPTVAQAPSQARVGIPVPSVTVTVRVTALAAGLPLTGGSVMARDGTAALAYHR